LVGAVNTGLCSDAEQGWKGAGIRAGVSATPKHEYFHRYDAYAVYGLPWEWRTTSGWGLSPQLDIMAGILNGGDETGFIGSVGPSIVLDKPGIGLELELGINADILDRREFGKQDFGSILLFGANMGITYRFYHGIGIGYRLEHLSNGHIFYPNGTSNTGLDLHMVTLDWRF
jgi:hypothetical protein